MSKKASLDSLTTGATLSEIVTADPGAGELLKSIGLKRAEHKDQSLRSVCQQFKWSEAEVLRWIKRKCNTKNEVKKDSVFGESLVQSCEYLIEKFHKPNREMLIEIEKDFPRVHQIHGNQYPWLKNMQWQFERFEEALKMYYRFEEKKFYSLLSKVESTNGDLLYGSIKKLERSIDIIKKDQSRLHEFMKKLRVDSNGFENPEGACSTLRILNQTFKMLFESIENQFQIERDELLPAVQKEIETVYS